VDRQDRTELQRLVARLADGDREAFHPVFARAWPLVRGFTGRHLAADDAEDAAQEALVKVFRNAGAFDRDRDALSWILGIAAWEVRTALQRRRRRREEPAGGAGARAGDPAEGPVEESMARELEAALEGALGRLDPPDRVTLRAYARGDRPDHIPPATFRKRVQRALARLRGVWRATHD